MDVYFLFHFRHEGWRVGMLGHYRAEAQTNDLELVFSRDGQTWQRPLPSAWVPRGGPGESDHFAIYPARDILDLPDGKSLLLYSGHAEKHSAYAAPGPPPMEILAAEFDKDRLAGVGAGKVVGTYRSRAFILTRPTLAVNAVIRGQLRAELCDAFGEPLPGFRLADCQPVHGDSPRHVLRWKRDTAEAQYDAVTLRLEFSEGEIFGIEYGSILAEESEKTTPPTERNAMDGAEMILIPAGRFLMGSTRAEVDAQFRDTGLPEDWKKHTLDEEPRHERTLEPFYLYKYEVTNAQYRAFIDATGHSAPPHWKGKDYPADKGEHPVVEVSWDDAQVYCRWAGTQLPTEAQWEYAARGPEPADGKPSRVFPWGDAWDRQLSNNASFHAGKELQNAEDWKKWYEGDQKSLFPLTSRVGSFPKSVSPLGVHDMAGNAWEWCAEIQAPYPDQRADGAQGEKLRARRGGSWANVALHIRSADRQGAPHDDLNIYTGFRCVKIP